MNDSINNLIQLLEHRAEHSTDKVCCTFHVFSETTMEYSSVSVTYSQLYTLAKGVAARIMQQTEKNDRVLILAKESLELYIMYWGCILSGRTAVLLYTPDNRYQAFIENTIKDCSPSLVLIEKELSKSLKRIKWFGGLISLGAISSKLTQDLNVSADVLRKSGLWEIPFMVYSEKEALEASETWEMPKISQDDLTHLQYTSGSAGEPKGTMISHKNLLTNLDHIAKCFRATDKSVVVSWLPINHDQGLVGGVISPMWWNSATHLFSSKQFIEKPARWLQLISDFGAVVSGAPNFAYEVCLRKISEDEKKGINLRTWDLAFNGAEPVLAETLQRFTDAFKECGFQSHQFLPCYGMAELTLLISGASFQKDKMLLEIDKEAFQKHQLIKEKSPSSDSITLVSSGLSYCETLIVDPETLTPLKEREVGEILLCDKSVTQGYWNNPEITSECKVDIDTEEVRKTFFKTGDLGFLNEGYLYITGRREDLIIIEGRYIYPQEIENYVTSSWKECRKGCCAAFSVYKNSRKQIVVAAEIRQTTFEEEYQNLIISIQEAISETFSAPVYDVLLFPPKSLPKTFSGKLRRIPTRDAYLNNKLPSLASLKI